MQSDAINDGLPLTETVNQQSLVIVPKFQVGCRVCTWAKDDVELYNWVSTLALQGYNSGKIYTLLTENLIKNYTHIKPPSRKSIWRHFTTHIQPKESVEIAAARRVTGSINPTDPLVGQTALEEIKSGNFDEYKELCDLYVKFREVHDKIYQLADALTTSKCETTDWSQTKISTYVSMVNTQKTILAEINKMRQGDKLVVTVAKYIVEMFAKNMVSKLSDEFETFGHIMKRQNVDNAIIQAFDVITHQRLAQLILDEANNAMTATKKEFKLPD